MASFTMQKAIFGKKQKVGYNIHMNVFSPAFSKSYLSVFCKSVASRHSAERQKNGSSAV